jgi:amino acid adenylation domain-containing protein
MNKQVKETPQGRKAAIRAFLERQKNANDVALVPLPASGTAPQASFSQQRLWFIDQLAPGTALYNIAAAVRLSGALDTAVLTRALAELVRRHETLRTVFRADGGVPLQIIAVAQPVVLPVLDLDKVAPLERAARVEELVKEEASRPFDLAVGPLYRASLIRLEEHEHVFLFTLHHIIADGWSMAVVVDEIATLYTAYVRGEPSPLPEPAIQYADYAHWQRQWLTGEVLDKQLRYWRAQLAGCPALLALPLDRPRSAAQTYRGATHRVEVSAATCARLEAFGKEANATLFMILAAAFNIILARYSGQDDICIGTPIANRNRSALEGLIGFFVNTIVIRTKIRDNCSFAELVQDVRATALGAYAHQDVPFDRLVEVIRPQRQASYSPLFQVMLALQNAPVRELALPGLTLQSAMTDTDTAKFDLSLAFSAGDGCLSGAFEYNTDLFDAATIARMAGHFICLLDTAVADPAAPVHALSMMGPAELHQVLVGWNIGPAAPPPPPHTLHWLFEEQVRKTPDAAAVVFEDAILTYAELNARANALAHYLCGRGVGPDTMVGLCVERSLAMIVGVLGILKAGGAYLPLDPAYPAERLAYILGDARPAVLLTQESVRTTLPPCEVPLCCLDTDWPAITAYGSDNPEPRGVPANLAYVIYTSGSTGTPKGVLMQHQNVTRLFTSTDDWFGFSRQDVWTMFHSFAFDFSVWEIWGALLHGGKLVVVPFFISRSPRQFLELIEREGVTILNQTPSAFQQLIDVDMKQVPRARLSLRKVIFGGEALNEESLAPWFDVHGYDEPALINMYGITETAVHVTYCRVTEGQEIAGTIGRPLPDLRTYILDPHANPVPVGIPGELFIAGPGLARGYLNRPELTAQQFVPDPYSDVPGARMYRSGDVARYQADGSIVYMGRMDHQVKIRGFRIELGEIEAALARSMLVRDCLVLAREDVAGDKRLVAYVVYQNGADGNVGDEAALRAELCRTLPAYMVPSHVIRLDALPLNANGKVERALLPAPDSASAAPTGVAPRTGTEEALALVWAETLGCEKVGVTDSFFDLGGHSLLATQLVSRLRAIFGIDIALRTLFDSPTIEALACHVEQLQQDQPVAAAPAIVPLERGGDLPLSFAQQRLWFLDQFEPDSALYNMSASVRLSGELDIVMFQRAVHEMVARHEALRTVFGAHDGVPFQRILPAVDVALPVLDLAGMPLGERNAKAQWLAQDEAQARFNLASGPLIRATLLRMDEQEHILLFTLHHIVSDGWSIGVVVNEMAALYGAYVRGLPSPLAPLAIQYVDFAYWQRQWLAGEALARQLDYWTRQLAGSPALLALPLDRPRPALQSHRGALYVFQVPKEITVRVHAFASEHKATVFMTLAATLNILLARYSGQGDICVGTPIANRARRELEPLIGFFVNTLVLRTAVESGATFIELVNAVRATALEAYAHQDLPFEQLVDVLQPERVLSHSPLFQVMLTLQEDALPSLDLPGLRLEPVATGTASAKFDLTLNIVPDAQQLSASFEYNTDLFDSDTIETMAAHFTQLLDAALAQPRCKISQLPMMGPGELDRLLRDWNDTPARLDTALTLHQLFEAQADRTPDALALVFETTSLTYAELNARANRLANFLRARQAGPETVVALCLERSIEMVVGLLGVLKAGAAYLPLDPAYPRERLEFMLADANACFVLTQEALRASLTPRAIPVFCLDLQWGELEAYSSANRVHAGLADSLAYVIYTSGSTGKPKGVAVSHAGIVNRLAWMQAEYGLGADDRVLQKTPYSFDVSVWEFFWTLGFGATLVIARPNGHQDPRYLASVIEAANITTLHFVPPMLEEFLNSVTGTLGGILTRVFCSGQALPAELQRRFFQQLPHVALHNLYGPTEASVDVTYWRCDPQDESAMVPIGRPIANTQIYLLDNDFNPVPPGAAGELYIGGTGLARGYLSRAGLTAECFVPNPFGAAGSRLYRSGDLARHRKDGAIEYLGRRDHQVKIRGFRIELGEIEAALARVPGVRACVVLARQDGPGGECLVAYIVAEPGQSLAIDDVRKHLGQELPDHMLPAMYVTLVAFPLMPNGKLDRGALPAPGLDAILGGDHEAPSSETEAAVANIWMRLLELPRVGRHDNFFHIGGNSLLAVQLVARFDAELGVKVALRDLFSQRTLADMAALIATTERAASSAPILLAPRDHGLPLSWSQQRLWFLDQLDGSAGAAYHMAVGLRMRGRLDRAALGAALDRIVQRHEILRTTFGSVDGSPVQVVAAEGGFVLEELDLRAADGAQSHEAVEYHARTEASRPFDFVAGPLMRGKLLVLGEHDHILLITQHHIISDGWSMGVMVNELSTLYAAFQQRQPDPLPALSVQFADYAVWQREWFRDEVLTQQLDFWRASLEGAPALITLPTDRPRPAVQDYVSAELGFTLSPELTDGLRQLAQRHGATLFMTLLSAWSILLSRLSGQDDIVVGTSVANRPRAELEPLIGLFINTLALRVRLDADPDIGELLGQVRRVTLDAFTHQDLPFERVVEALQPVRSMSHNPVFQTMLSMNNTPRGAGLVLPGLALERIDIPGAATGFDLHLSLRDDGDAIACRLEYACALFDAGAVDRMAGQFQTLIRHMLKDERAAVSRLPLLTPDERARLLPDPALEAPAGDAGELIHRLFELRVDACPDALAVVYEGKNLTYDELNRRANQLAHHLHALGVKPDDRIAICVERSLETVVGLMGILKAGAAYVPLDPGHPAQRVEQMLADAQPLALLTQQALVARFAGLAIPVLALDAGTHTWEQQPQENPAFSASAPASHNLAYVIYTSGSTGVPKGVMVEHRSAINFWRVLENRIYRDCPAPAKLALNASYTFDMSLKGILQLLSGHCLVIVPQDVRASGADLLAFFEAHRIDAFDCTPSQLEVLLAAGLLDNARYQPTTVLIGGEPINGATWRKLAAARGTRFHNMYGPTECTVDATTGLIEAADSVPHIGKPIDNVQVYILDRHLNPVPQGVYGEIHIGGTGLARGYLNRPELTEARFIAWDAGHVAPVRIYKTGDVGRWLAGGNIEYLGRNDNQVKIRGFRIELGEIEAAIAGVDTVGDCAVVAREEAGGEKRLVAYLVPAPERTLEIAAVHAHLTRVLTDFMMPGAYVTLAALPLTANGKLDRAALPAPDANALLARTYQAPEGEIELAIAEIWRKLLSLGRVGRQDHFFELGGHSLLAVQLISRLRKRFGVKIALRDLFAHATLSALAQVVAQAGYAVQSAIPPADRTGLLPLSWAQQRLWFLAELDRGASAAYHMAAALRMQGKLDRGALQAALDRMVHRHENLRTTFHDVDGQSVQVIAPAGIGFSLQELDLSAMPEEAREALIARHAATEAAEPFDFRTGPLIRGKLLMLAPDAHILLITQHHIISDGWSTSVIIKEISALYGAFTQGKPDPLPPLGIQYADYTAWQRQWFQGEALQAQLDFWRSYLAGAPSLLELPTDRPRPAVQTYAGDYIVFTLPERLTAGLRALSQRHGVTLFMTMLGGWSALLSRLSGQDDVVIGTSVANRSRTDLEALIGFFVNTLPLRVRLDADQTVADLLAQVKAATLGAYAHQDLPFEQVVEALQPVRSMSHSPIFQSSISMNIMQKEGVLALPGIVLTPMPLKADTSHFDLGLSLSDEGSVITAYLEYASDLFDKCSVERMAGHFETLLSAMTEGDAAPVAQLQILTDSQREQLLVEFNVNEPPPASEQLIHQLFEQRAAEHPDAIALVCAERSMTYSELNRQANRVAHYLIGLGVQADERVAICVERSLETVIGILGILKAGGAYVPLDPSYPAERLAQMLGDSEPIAVLTHASWVSALSQVRVPVVTLDASHANPVLDSQLESNPRLDAAGPGPDSLAYVIYTSGSTGTPKGVMVEHRSVVSLVTASVYSDIGSADCIAHCSNPAFDAATWEIWGALVNGARLLIVPHEVLFDAVALNRYLVAGRASAMYLTVALFRAYNDSLEQAFAGLRYLILGGEALDPNAVARALRKPRPPQHILNGYGPTETTTFAAVYDVREVRDPAQPISIGRPIAGTRLYILDDEMNPVPLGVKGELYIGGEQVARGYLNKRSLTEARFVRNPFARNCGDKLYKTGDLACWLADGNIEYLGRNDHQVKIRGFRIELGEIEAALSSIAGVREVVVVAIQRSGDDKYLLAYIVGEAPDTSLDLSALRRSLSDILPQYMVPAHFIQMPALTLTPNGKVDRGVLPVPDTIQQESEFIAAATPTEKAVAAIWAEILKLEKIGVNDDFFALGGHSLMATQIASKIRSVFDLHISLRTLFEYSTIKTLAARLDTEFDTMEEVEI